MTSAIHGIAIDSWFGTTRLATQLIYPGDASQDFCIGWAPEVNLPLATAPCARFQLVRWTSVGFTVQPGPGLQIELVKGQALGGELIMHPHAARRVRITSGRVRIEVRLLRAPMVQLSRRAPLPNPHFLLSLACVGLALILGLRAVELVPPKPRTVTFPVDPAPPRLDLQYTQQAPRPAVTRAATQPSTFAERSRRQRPPRVQTAPTPPPPLQRMEQVRAGANAERNRAIHTGLSAAARAAGTTEGSDDFASFVARNHTVWPELEIPEGPAGELSVAEFESAAPTWGNRAVRLGQEYNKTIPLNSATPQPRNEELLTPYRAQLAKCTASGTRPVVVRFTIAANGHAAEVEFEGDPPTRSRSCVRAVLDQLHVPAWPRQKARIRQIIR